MRIGSRSRHPRGIELDYTLAGLGSRFIAASVDAVIRIAVLAALLGVMAALGAGSTLLLIVLIVGSFLALFAYDVAFEVWAGGRTPGKRWSGLRVLMANGQPVSFAPSAVRNLMRIIDEWATALIAGHGLDPRSPSATSGSATSRPERSSIRERRARQPSPSHPSSCATSTRIST